MSVAGEIATIVGLVQTGFSLAKAITAYISDVGSAKDDILTLLSDIDATCRSLRDLADIIKRNETRRVWSEDGLENAKKCVRDSQRVITKMRKLLTKATASGAAPEVTKEDIDVTKFERSKWPLLKPELEVRRQELQIIKQDIILCYTTYQAKAADTPDDRQRAADDLPRLERMRKLMKGQIIDAKKRRTRSRFAKDSKHGGPYARIRDQHDDILDPQAYSRRSYSDDGSVDDALDEFIYNNIDDLIQDFEDWAKGKEEKRKRAEEETKRIQDRAVEDWKRQQREEAERLRKQTEEAREKLRTELNRQQLAPAKIEDTLNNVHPWPQALGTLALLPPPDQDKKSDADADSTQSGNNRKSRGQSIWSRVSTRRSSNDANIDTSQRHPKIPEFLRDPFASGGVAELKAFFYSRIHLSSGSAISPINVEIPSQWLLNALIAKEEKYLKDPKGNSFWKEFAQLPDDYRYAINRHVDSWQESSKTQGSWVLIYIECLRMEQKYARLLRNRPDEITGIYVVLKRVSGSMQARLADATHHAAGDGGSVASDRSRESTRLNVVESRSDIDDDAFKPALHRASVIRRDHSTQSQPRSRSRSRSRSYSYGRDPSIIAKRASFIDGQDRYDEDDDYGDVVIEPVEVRVEGPRSRSRRRDSTSFHEREIVDNIIRLPPPPQNYGYSNEPRYVPEGVFRGPPLLREREGVIYPGGPTRSPPPDEPYMHPPPPSSPSPPPDTPYRYKQRPGARLLEIDYYGPQPDGVSVNNPSRPSPPRRSASGSDNDRRARISSQPPTIINNFERPPPPPPPWPRGRERAVVREEMIVPWYESPRSRSRHRVREREVDRDEIIIRREEREAGRLPPPRRRSYDLRERPSRSSTLDSVDSAGSEKRARYHRGGYSAGPALRHTSAIGKDDFLVDDMYHASSHSHHHHHRAPLSPVREGTNDNDEDEDDDLATHSSSTASSVSSSSDESGAGPGKRGDKRPDAARDETEKSDADIAREILARLTTDTEPNGVAAGGEAGLSPEQHAHGSEEGESSATRAASSQSQSQQQQQQQSTTGILGVGMSEEPAAHQD
ncbi:hypothetical protein G647_10100 [Cladophialophora carrionii CBS 160.54]|uniref:Fungal N-terminal domain-containing protein n=1 Tax=Cladophialophora carrionii CBS 160.54 TaxID=1279043 RepID=V9DJY9_9EURO|nr:uncharacterized protein G647_10100 [Cladophialophora carrionii CBS 160.54]ETI27001.1 hypothetical protein G647_10100 [Cladophialophora carrionii CBS 160.54]